LPAGVLTKAEDARYVCLRFRLSFKIIRVWIGCLHFTAIYHGWR